jgi:hypothetical protein
MIRIELAATAADFELAQELSREYAEGLGIDLCFQSFEEELARLAEMYGAPIGWLLLARDDESGEAAGCVGLRRLDDATGEMKRMYVDGRIVVVAPGGRRRSPCWRRREQSAMRAYGSIRCPA